MVVQLKELLNLIMKHFPERIERILIVKSGVLFTGAWAMLQGWLPERTHKKVAFLTDTECAGVLQGYMSLELLPKIYGGLLLGSEIPCPNIRQSLNRLKVAQSLRDPSGSFLRKIPLAHESASSIRGEQIVVEPEAELETEAEAEAEPEQFDSSDAEESDESFHSCYSDHLPFRESETRHTTSTTA